MKLLKYDQTTIANMTAALEYVCRKLPPDRDNQAIRKHIAEAMVAAADAGQISLAEFKNAGLAVVNQMLFPPRRLS